jgi:hypothetical protein
VWNKRRKRKAKKKKKKGKNNNNKKNRVSGSQMHKPKKSARSPGVYGKPVGRLQRGKLSGGLVPGGESLGFDDKVGLLHDCDLMLHGLAQVLLQLFTMPPHVDGVLGVVLRRQPHGVGVAVSKHG